MKRKEYEGIIYVSEEMERVRRDIEDIAEIEIPVLITGENGVGKELVANAIKNRSRRKDGKLVVIDCAGMKYELFESELFGHVRGAYTGAIANRKGLFETASGGMVFIDEISEIPLNLQARLLRLIETRTFRPVGSSDDYRSANVRVLAATNKDLSVLVEEGKFRADLYYRLKRFCINIPPLREHREDTTVLVPYFAEKFQKLHNRELKRPVAELIPVFMHMEWKGNVRELENAVESEVIKPFSAMGDKFLYESALDDNSQHPNGNGLDRLTLKGVKEFVERAMIKEALARHRTIEAAAKSLLVNPKTLSRHIIALGIDKKL